MSKRACWPVTANPARVWAAILAGGLGTRLKPVIGDRPKALADVGGRPFLGYLLDQLVFYGFQTVVLCTGHLGKQIEDEFGDAYRSLRLRYSQEHAPLGTGGSLQLALPLLQSDPVLVMNGDSFCDVDLRDVLRLHAACAAVGTIVLAKVPDASRFGGVEVDADSRVIDFAEKDACHAGRAGLVNAGVYVLNISRLVFPEHVRPASMERDFLPAWVVSGLYGYCAEGVFVDIGTPDSYQHAAEALAHTNFVDHRKVIAAANMGET